MSSTDGGIWLWNIDTYDAKFEAVWENPLAGWQRGCLAWTPISQCESGGGRSLATEL